MNVESKQFTLMPPPRGVCQECAVDHEPEQPHNPQSFYYRVNFNMQHGRLPTWADAMEHCSEEVKAAWTEGLAEFGVKV